MECVRCGQCCIAVGRTFWLHGDFEDYPELLKLAESRESKDDGLPCEMLQMVDGVAACKIELLYGREAKPEVCQDYPKKQCYLEAGTIKGRVVCYLKSG